MNKCSRITGVLMFLIVFSAHCTMGQKKELKVEIEKILQKVKADVGVAIKHLENGDTLSVNGHDRFPMQSVYKFHLALKVLKEVESGKLSLDQVIHIPKESLFTNTWSPILKEYPDRDIDLSIQALLSYLISYGDNNVCDVLFRLVGGPEEVEKYIHSLGITNVAIANTEEEMHKAWSIQFDNWSSPVAMVQLLELFYSKDIISARHRDLLFEMMIKTITGGKRIKGLLPSGTIVAHRTGMGGPNDEGVLGALNDVGIVKLPDGNHFAVTVFISNTKEDPAKLEEIIAEISKVVYNHYARKK